MQRTVVKGSFFIALLFTGYVFSVFAQADHHARPRLGILPFVGGVYGDGDTIAGLLASSQEILDAFTLIPLSAEAVAVASERLIQMAAFADSDIVAGIGRMIGADYVVSGHLRRIEGNRNLVIVTVVCVESLELVTGYHRAYRNLWETRDFIPSMSGSLAGAILSRPAADRPPRLAVAPFAYGYLDTDHDMETLAQILAIEIANSGAYSVLPRASVMRAALDRWEARIAGEMDAALELLLELLLGDPGAIDETEAYAEPTLAVTDIGRAAGADMVLSLDSRGLGDISMFVAQVLRTEDGAPLAGASRGYRTLTQGMNLMSEIAIMLTDPDGAPQRLAALTRQRRMSGMFGDPARFWSLGVSVGTSMAAPWVIGTLQASLAPFPFSFLRLGGDFGFLSGIDDVGYFSMYPFAHYAFFLPFSWGGWHLGVGGGFLIARHTFHDLAETRRGFLADFGTGLNIMDRFEVSYTLRTDFSSLNGKFSAGFIHRFRTGER